MLPLLFICASLKVVCVLQPLLFLPAESAHVVPVRFACSANGSATTVSLCGMNYSTKQVDKALLLLLDELMMRNSLSPLEYGVNSCLVSDHALQHVCTML